MKSVVCSAGVLFRFFIADASVARLPRVPLVPLGHQCKLRGAFECLRVQGFPSAWRRRQSSSVSIVLSWFSSLVGDSAFLLIPDRR